MWFGVLCEQITFVSKCLIRFTKTEEAPWIPQLPHRLPNCVFRLEWPSGNAISMPAASGATSIHHESWEMRISSHARTVWFLHAENANSHSPLTPNERHEFCVVASTHRYIAKFFEFVPNRNWFMRQCICTLHGVPRILCKNEFSPF